jgi:3',5'-cyclic AMP phosphodiesterase CpdA
VIFAQLSDLHILPEGQLAYGVVNTATMLANALEHLEGLPFSVDFVLATGDLVDHGSAVEYTHLRALLGTLNVPCFFVIGNHDEREALRSAFASDGALVLHPDASRSIASGAPTETASVPRSEAESAGPASSRTPVAIRASGLKDNGYLQYTVEAQGLRILVLDTVVPGEGGGAMCVDRLHWLETHLLMDEMPTVIAMHHPPFATGIAHMDAISLQGADDFERLVARFPQVRRIVCGHLHRPIQADVAGTTAITAPSVAHQIVLHLGHRGTAAGAFPRGSDCFVMEPPGYLLHWWDGRRLTTHQCVIGSYPGPFPFRAD